MMRILIALLLLVPLSARGAERLTVVELFTSQGCSSCPPADALLAELAAGDPGVLPLGMHVTYWDRLGWKDPFSLPAATERQHAASARAGLDHVYTPQVVVDGVRQGVGSDAREVRRLIAAARSERREGVAVNVLATDAGVVVTAGAGAGRGTLLVVGFDARHVTAVGRGENGGRTLTEVNVVRAIVPAGAWSGGAVSFAVPRPAGEKVAVLLQAADGRILGVGVL